MINFLAVFLGGGLGSLLRHITNLLAQKLCFTTIWATLTVNILGCFLIGLIWGLSIQKENLMPTHMKLFLTVGFLGGLTTFSTFSCETFNLLKDDKITLGFLYIAISIVVGLTATCLGYLLSKQIRL